MKKKSASKSKDRDKNKNDETKSHKHSRRRRKSSSSESEAELDVKAETVEEVKPKRGAAARKETENNVATQRITRHSKRLAAISAGSDEIKEELSEVASPIKTGKLSPFSGECKGSPSKERKRDSGTPDKHRPKDSEVWKVKSANGAGTGELQKLKICRQRSPEPEKLVEQEQNNVESSIVEIEQAETNNACENEKVEQVAFPVDEEDIANIQLPSDDLQPPIAIEAIPIPEDVPSDIPIPEDIPSDIPIPEDVPSDIPIPENVPSDIPIPEDVPSESVTQEVYVNQTEINIVPEVDISEICLPADEPKQPVQYVEEYVLVQPEQPAESVSKQKSLEVIKTEESITEVSEIPEPQETPMVEEPPQPEELVVEVSQRSPPLAVEEPTPSESIPVQEIEKQSSPVVSETEDNMQTELVLTVEEPLEEAVELIEPEILVEAAAEKSAAPEQEPDRRLNKSVEEMEVYDYEHDDTREEGELSANESISPIHEVFKRHPIGVRSRMWGSCNVFHFDRTNFLIDEQVLKELNIKKRVVSKEELDTSDPEDLIFVKEIREENIVHEIESENNNTFVDKDDDDVVPLSPKYDSEKETSKKRVSDSDRRKSYSRDRLNDEKSSSKRSSRESKSQNADGRTVLYITNLVRPFTVTQLRELLLRTGKIVDDGFWIDSIKSKCYVQFETSDEATETRHALHGIRWPVNNPKVLSVQFASQDDLLSAQAQTHESEIPRKTEPLVVENHNDQRRGIDWKKHFEQYDERPVRKIKDVREWDIGKPAHPDEMIYAEPEDARKTKDDADRSRKQRNKDRRRRNENSDDESISRKQRKTANDSGVGTSGSTQPPTEAKLLDDLFKRTKASPSIYWLPLSDEQIAIKEETRRKHLEDIDKQLKKRDGDGDRRRDRDRRRSRR